VLLVTFVGSLIHVYSLGYMEHDHGQASLLRLPEPLCGGDAHCSCSPILTCCFTSAGKVWVSRPICSSASGTGTLPYATAANKAFIANRVGDFGHRPVAIMADVLARSAEGRLRVRRFVGGG
jgi:NADH-quinone oxidoreductase subunit L